MAQASTGLAWKCCRVLLILGGFAAILVLSALIFRRTSSVDPELGQHRSGFNYAGEVRIPVSDLATTETSNSHSDNEEIDVISSEILVKLRFVVVSDTHMDHELIDLPLGDYLVFLGDMTNAGKPEEFAEFNAWMERQSPRYFKKIVIAGNHDFDLDLERRYRPYELQEMLPCCVYLESSSISFPFLSKDPVLANRRIVVHGIPWIPNSERFYWEHPRDPPYRDRVFFLPEGEIASRILRFPGEQSTGAVDAHVFLSHIGPYGVLDRLSVHSGQVQHRGSRAIRWALLGRTGTEDLLIEEDPFRNLAEDERLKIKEATLKDGLVYEEEEEEAEEEPTHEGVSTKLLKVRETHHEKWEKGWDSAKERFVDVNDPKDPILPKAHVHVFGHVHTENGFVWKRTTDHRDVLFVNAASGPEFPDGRPVVFDIVVVA